VRRRAQRDQLDRDVFGSELNGTIAILAEQLRVLARRPRCCPVRTSLLGRKGSGTAGPLVRLRAPGDLFVSFLWSESSNVTGAWHLLYVSPVFPLSS
jgi:hypothetical protein